MAKTSTNLDENVASALSYVLGWITGLIFFLLEKENKVVRFHAMQSIIVFGALSIIGALPFIWTVGWLIGALGFVLWIILIIKAYQGGIYKLPIAGDLAEKWSK
jgi:uncharacterized membrane protein